MFRKVVLVISVSLFFAISVCAQGTTAGTASTTPAPTAKKPAVFRPTKDQIKQVQAMLKDKKLYTGEASGTYNDPTRTGIKGFQKDNGLKETGTLNRATLEKFGVELTDGQKLIPVSPSSFASPASEKTKAKTVKKTVAPTTETPKTATASTPTAETPKKAAPFRATLDQIKAAQKLLKDKSMYTGDQTGKLDPATREGLKKFKAANGMTVTDTLNAATLEKMGIELTDKQKADAPAAPKN